jgi:hypothetical protein
MHVPGRKVSLDMEQSHEVNRRGSTLKVVIWKAVAYEGYRCRIVYAVCLDQTRPGEQFYDELSDSDKAKLNKLFEHLGDHGKISNKEKFKKIEATDFFEFKSFQIRMPCFFREGALVIITHGFRKKGDRISPAEIKRAERIKEEDAKNEYCEGSH